MSISHPPVARAPRRVARPRPPEGVQGNEALTRVTATVLLLLLAAEGITVVSIEGLVRPHMFIGMVLIPPILLKLATTGYRFARYYAGSPAYRAKGPPPLILRLTAPILVLATVSVFTTGVWLMALGHGSDSVLSLHVASVVVWLGAFAIHLFAHLPRVARSLKPDWRALLRRSVAGSETRAMLLAAALGGGVALAIATLSLITAWHGE